MNCISFVGKGGATATRVLAVAAFAFMAWAPAYAQVPVVGGDSRSLGALVENQALVTVVLKGGARDPNQRVKGVESDRLIVEGRTGLRNVYLFSDIQEIRVQQDEVEARPRINVTRALNSSEQAILARAIERLAEIYEASEGDQFMRLLSAGILAASDPVAASVMTSSSSGGTISARIADARNYLEELTETNDVETAVLAATHLWYAGYPERAQALVGPALDSPRRRVRIAGAELAGLVGDSSVQGTLLRMLDDRSADLSAPAAVALARLGNRDIIPQVLDMAMELSDEKGRAAVRALTLLGGPDVVQQVKQRIEKAQNVPRFRLAMVLYNLDDPQGERMLSKEYLNVPSLARDAAIALAKKGNVSGLDYLRNLLDQRYDETLENMMFRARAAAALIEGGDLWAVSVIQEAMRNPNPLVRLMACAYIAEAGHRSLLTVLQPAISEGQVPPVAVMGSAAALAIADSGFHERITSDPLDADLQALVKR